MGQNKKAVFDLKKREKLIKACKTDNEFIVIWIFMFTGMHPKNLAELKLKNLDDEGWLRWKRAKNAKPRSELLPDDVAEALREFLKNKFRPRNRTSYWEICKIVGERVGIKALSPMSLRHTFCIIELDRLKGHPDRLDLVAVKMGCRKSTVMQNYLDMIDWERRK